MLLAENAMLKPDDQSGDDAFENPAAVQPMKVDDPQGSIDREEIESEAVRRLKEEMLSLRERIKTFEIEKEEKEKVEKAQTERMEEENFAKANEKKKTETKESQSVLSDDDYEKNSDQENEKESGEQSEEECSPLPSEPSSDEIDEEDEMGEERSARAARKEKLKKNKIALKISTKMELEERARVLSVATKAEQTARAKLDSFDEDASAEETALFKLQQELKEGKAKVAVKLETMKKAGEAEREMLLQEQNEKRKHLEEQLRKEREELRMKLKQKEATLQPQQSNLKDQEMKIDEITVEMEKKKQALKALKETLQKRIDEKKKAAHKHEKAQKAYNALSLRAQNEMKQQEPKGNSGGSWMQAVGRGKPPKKPHEQRKIPKHALPQFAPKERYHPHEKIPCPSWITRVAKTTKPCPKEKNCPHILRGCNLFHRDADMIVAFEHGIRPVGWSELHESNLEIEINYWNRRTDHSFQIPDETAMSSWKVQKDTEEDMERERQRIAALLVSLREEKMSRRLPTLENNELKNGGAGGPATEPFRGSAPERGGHFRQGRPRGSPADSSARGGIHSKRGRF